MRFLLLFASSLLCGCESTDTTAAVDGSFKPAEIPSTRTVSFHVTNGLSEPIVLLDDATTCSMLKIERLEGSNWVDLSLDANARFNDPSAFCCNAACDPSLSFTGRQLSPGGATDLTWDARALVFSNDTYKCGGQTRHWCAPQPVGDGSYRVSVVYHAPFQDCAADGGAVSCSMSPMNDSYPMPFCLDLAIFGSQGFVVTSQTFALTGSGDVAVDIAIQ